MRSDNRRLMNLASVDALVAELDRIEAAATSGTLRTTGNWTAGQILAHLAAWIEYGDVGYPVKPPPFFVRWILRLMLRKILRDGMKPGVRIPGVAGGTTGADPMDTIAAIRRYRKAIPRLTTGLVPVFPSPAFGELSFDDYVKLQLRHAELHLSFLKFDSI